MRFVTFFLLIFCSCTSQKELLLQGSSEVEFINLPLSLNVLTAIDSEERFDQYSPNMKDTIYLAAKDLKFLLGKKLKGISKIDIRIKATVVDSYGLQKKVFLSRTGVLIYDGQVYEGSKQVRMLIKRVDSLRLDNNEIDTW